MAGEQQLGSAVLYLKTDDSQYKQGISAAKGAAQDLETQHDATTESTKNLSSSFVDFAAKALLVYEALKKVVDFGKQCFDEFVKDQQASARLSDALRITGQYSRDASEGIEAMAQALATHTTYSKSASEAAAGLLIQIGNLTSEGVAKALPLLQDYATALGVDLSTAAEQFTAAMEGGRNMFAKYGIDLKGAHDPTQRFDELIVGLTSHFGGMADAMGKTVGGQIAIFKNQVDQLKASVGALEAALLLPGLKAVNATLAARPIFGADIEGASSDTLKQYQTILSDYAATLKTQTQTKDVRAASSGAALQDTIQLLASITEVLRRRKVPTTTASNVNPTAPTGPHVASTTASEAGAMWGGELNPAALDIARPGSGDLSSSAAGAAWSGEQVPEGSTGFDNRPADLAAQLQPSIAGWGAMAQAAADAAAKAKQAWLDALSGIQSALNFTGNILNQFGNLMSQLQKNDQITLDNKHKKEVDGIQSSYDAQKKAIEDSTDDAATKNAKLAALDVVYNNDKTALEKKQQEESAKLQTKAAQEQKDMSIFQAILSTANAVVNALATVPAPYNFIEAGIVGALGAAQIAAISAQPIPAFARGGDFTVPPGYPNDSYLMRAQSGEHVSVTPSGADPFRVTVNLDGRPILDMITKASRNRQILINQGAVVPMM